MNLIGPMSEQRCVMIFFFLSTINHKTYQQDDSFINLLRTKQIFTRMSLKDWLVAKVGDKEVSRSLFAFRWQDWTDIKMYYSYSLNML